MNKQQSDTSSFIKKKQEENKSGLTLLKHVMFLIHYDVGTHIQLQTGFVSRKNAKGKFLKTENFVTVQKGKHYEKIKTF